MEETTRPFQRQKWDLEVQGRVQNADIPYLAKHLILLHRNHHLTTLLAQKAHSCVFYNRTKETLTELRSTKHGLMKIIYQPGKVDILHTTYCIDGGDDGPQLSTTFSHFL